MLNGSRLPHTRFFRAHLLHVLGTFTDAISVAHDDSEAWTGIRQIRDWDDGGTRSVSGRFRDTHASFKGTPPFDVVNNAPPLNESEEGRTVQ